MNDSTIALIIGALTIVCFATELLPLPITAVSSAIAMGIFGVIPFPAVFAGFASDATMLVVGAMIIGEAIFVTGLADQIGHGIIRLVGADERRFLVACVAVSAILSAFLSNTAVVAMMMPVIAATAASSGGSVTKKNTYMAIGFAANIGGGMTLVGSTPNVVVQGLLHDAGLPTMHFFDLAPGGLPRLLFFILFYATFGYYLQKKVFTFPERANQPMEKGSRPEAQTPSRLKMWLAGLILLGAVAGFVTQIWTVGTVAMVGGLLCVILRLVQIKQLLPRLDWGTVWVLSGSLGMAAGIDQSGAGRLIANAAIGLFGESISYFSLMIVFTLIAVLMGNLMSSTASAAILGTIAIHICAQLGFDVKPIMLIIVWNLNLAFATPIGTPPVTMTLAGGYRFLDYTRVGGILMLGCILCTVVCYPFLFEL